MSSAPTEAPAHYKFSPSASSRWLACPGSLQFETDDDRSSEYAAEGTVAHALAHQCWMLGCEASVFIGQSRSADGFTFTITEEMTDAVQMYLDFVEQLADGSQVLAETKIEHSMVPGFGGTIDCAIPAKRHLVDFKYGAGLPVDVASNGEGSRYGFNSQMTCYALLFRDKFEFTGDVQISIVQPRASHPDGPIRTATIPEDHLADFMLQIYEVAEGKRDEEIHAGDHCRWCPAKIQCPELYELTVKTAQAEFDEEAMTPEKAGEILAMEKAIKGYVDAVSNWVHGRLDKGDRVPGYKLVERFGNRRYAADEETVVRRCRSRKIGKKQIYKTELLSPAQLEKVAGKDLVAELTERPNLGTTVVPESDRRKEVKRLTAADEFSNEDISK